MWSSRRVASVLAVVVPACSGVAVHAQVSRGGEEETTGPSSFMLTSGVDAPEEMCLVGVSGAVFLESCLAAVQVGDGKFLGALTQDGASPPFEDAFLEVASCGLFKREDSC